MHERSFQEEDVSSIKLWQQCDGRKSNESDIWIFHHKQEMRKVQQHYSQSKSKFQEFLDF